MTYVDYKLYNALQQETETGMGKVLKWKYKPEGVSAGTLCRECTTSPHQHDV